MLICLLNVSHPNNARSRLFYENIMDLSRNLFSWWTSLRTTSIFSINIITSFVETHVIQIYNMCKLDNRQIKLSRFKNMKIITSNYVVSVVIVPNYKNKNMAKDTKYVRYDSVPIIINMKKFGTRNPKTSMHEVYLVGCLDQLKNNEFALLVFVSI